ncbi:MAG: SMC-Scp complex subunit ScpB, partial [Planctomycetota bacterium]
MMEEAETTQAEDQVQEVEEKTAAQTDAGGEQPGISMQEEEELTALGEDELPRALEAVLFCAGEPVTIRELAELLEFGVHDVRSAVEKLREEYIDMGRSFRIEDISGGVQIMTVPQYDPWLRRLHSKQSSSRLSPAALETLAIIAYKGPITKAELENIRGVQCSPTIKTLLDRNFIRISGKAPGLGRPFLYHTTPLFLESFGLGSLKDLPQPEGPPPREDREDFEEDSTPGDSAAGEEVSEEEVSEGEVLGDEIGGEDVPGDEVPGGDVPGDSAE